MLYNQNDFYHAPVAQLDRASAFEAEGRGFESLRARHSNSDPNESDKLSVLPVHCEKTVCTSYGCFETWHQNEFFSTATFPSSTVRMRSMPGTVSVCLVPLGQ